MSYFIFIINLSEVITLLRFIALLLLINLIITISLFFKLDIVVVEYSTPHFVYTSEDLQKAYLDAIVYCGELNYAHRGEDIYCINKQIESKAPAEMKAYKRIKQFCRIKENNECDIENCITGIIIGY